MFCFYPRGLAAVQKCQALVYAPGCWQSDKGRVPEEPRVTWPCQLRHHRAAAPTGPGPSCCLCHRLPRQPWACPFASVSPMVGAETIRIHLPARSRGGECWHSGLVATTPWQGPTARGCGPHASAGLSPEGCKAHSTRGKGDQGSFPRVQPGIALVYHSLLHPVHPSSWLTGRHWGSSCLGERPLEMPPPC